MIDTVMAVTTVAVTDLDVARESYETRLGLVVLDTTPFAIRLGVAGSQIFVRRVRPNDGPARGAWSKDPDGLVFGVREGPVPAAS